MAWAMMDWNYMPSFTNFSEGDEVYFCRIIGGVIGYSRGIVQRVWEGSYLLKGGVVIRRDEAHSDLTIAHLRTHRTV